MEGATSGTRTASGAGPGPPGLQGGQGGLSPPFLRRIPGLSLRRTRFRPEFRRDRARGAHGRNPLLPRPGPIPPLRDRGGVQPKDCARGGASSQECARKGKEARQFPRCCHWGSPGIQPLALLARRHNEGRCIPPLPVGRGRSRDCQGPAALRHEPRGREGNSRRGRVQRHSNRWDWFHVREAFTPSRPGRSPALTRTWKPLQTPKMLPPSSLCS